MTDIFKGNIEISILDDGQETVSVKYDDSESSTKLMLIGREFAKFLNVDIIERVKLASEISDLKIKLAKHGIYE
jgi:hypothetical protein